ncbi:hypothetical protein [Myxacorys almedinensis]|uniref:Uncharacterized protein n=1 Tax=Myxacorys almedinensis A TaxID=2690445 RepID=A0A8J8CNG0_9CYAN|nr:hypothetical protein [Myxacorys almedinensis]NDJ19535.1 hypothetical protein [Myxacorys almedinensis A]
MIMRLFSKPSPKTFSLLSIGQRGVGKTVFLAGSYAELQGDDRSDHPQSSWFECQDSEVQSNLDKILYHVQQTGLYPPATIKITNFNFSLKHHALRGIKTLCNFRWWDIPGESCNLRNPDFQELVLNSHGCCVFINAQALVHDSDYAHTLEDIFNQVIAIASLIGQHRLNYAFALILTKCDALASGPATQLQLEQNLQPLTMRLDALNANYKYFYSAIPIVSISGTSMLNARGAADPLLWLLSELNKHHRFQPDRTLASSLTQTVFAPPLFPPHVQRSLLTLTLITLGLLGVVMLFLFAIGYSITNPIQVPSQEQPSRL